jgi:hypothetical protein
MLSAPGTKGMIHADIRHRVFAGQLHNTGILDLGAEEKYYKNQQSPGDIRDPEKDFLSPFVMLGLQKGNPIHYIPFLLLPRAKRFKAT